MLELNTSIFIIPAKFGGRNKKAGIKNGKDRVKSCCAFCN